MKRFVCLFAILCSVFTLVGCFIKNGKSGLSTYNPLNTLSDSPFNQPSNDISNYLNSLPKTSVTFQIVLPPNENENNLNSVDIKDISKNIITIDQANIPRNIKADSLSNPAVTFRLKLFATVAYDEQTTFLGQSSLDRNQVLRYHKRVRVDDASLASATFEGIPVLTAIGEIIIEGGSIQGYTEFQGALDLASQTNNVIKVYPKSRIYPTIPKHLNELIAETLQEVASDPYLLQDALPKLVTKLTSNSTNINLSNSSIYSDMLSVYKNLPRPMPAFLSAYYNVSLDPSTNIVNAGVYIDLPKESKILRSKLYCYSNYLSHPVRDNKTSFIKSSLGEIKSPTIVFIKKAEPYNYYLGGDSLIMAKLITEKDVDDKNIYISATSTAEALVLYDQRILSLPVASFTQIRQQLHERNDFRELVQMIYQQLISDNPYNDIMAENGDIWKKVKEIADNLQLGEITEKIINASESLPLSGSIRANTTNASYSDLLGVEDDKDRNLPTVVFYNKSYCYYDVFHLATEPLFTLERNEVLNEVLSWPPGSGRKEKTVNIGPGVFVFAFRKNLGLTLFDAFLTAFSTFVGYKIDNVEKLNEVYKVSSGIFLDFISELLIEQPKSWRDTYEMVYDFVINKNRLKDLLEILSKVGEHYAKKKLEDGWLKTATSFIAQKVFFWGNLAQGVSDIAASIYSSARSPSSFVAGGEQTTDGWFGDTFGEFVKHVNKIKSELVLYGKFSFNLSNGNRVVDDSFFKVILATNSCSINQYLSGEYFKVFNIIDSDNNSNHIVGQVSLMINTASRTISNVNLTIDRGTDGIIEVYTYPTVSIQFQGYSSNDEIGKVFKFKAYSNVIVSGEETIQPFQQVISNVIVRDYTARDLKFTSGPYISIPANIDAPEESFTLQELMWYYYSQDQQVFPDVGWEIVLYR